MPSARRPPIEPDRHADEAGLVPGALVAGRIAEVRAGSLLTRDTIAALPVSTTLPMTFADGVLDVVGGPAAVGRLDVELPPFVVHEHDEAPRWRAGARALEDLVNRAFAFSVP